ncbi:beta-N-acetylhexosaminidase [Saccharothrix yanglingensis]|uniref:beta-N-acetylhexosaminidase n=1 Tax=Saccharothrix yanglingensis TaxID=659496 RepID=UPI0027D28BCE|nr:beta-N-acetylhexosaminidase [Saccharothrix yanglingensis]
MNLLPRPVSFTPGDGEVDFDGTYAVERVDGPAEGYRLSVSPDGVRVLASDDAGESHARQTLRQLGGPAAFRAVPPGVVRLPVCEVVDHPRFAWRGVMIDVARHFLPKHDLLRYVDLLAAHKLNVLHLHLTDDQGWRFESRRFPRLHEVGGWRPDSRFGDRRSGGTTGRPHGGYYTQDDLRELVAYAAARHVTVVPEVDVPGHSQAAIAAYPELGVAGGGVWTDWGVNPNVLRADEATVDFYRHVFDELLDVFPSEVVGLGGDEAEGGDGRFVRRIAQHLAARGRRPFGWDEVLDVGPLPTSTVVASWRGEERGLRALDRGHDVVMCPEEHVYLDYRQSDHPDEPIPVGTRTTLEDVHRYEPAGADRVLGAQANLWTEHLDSPRRLDYAAFPRLSAFAEVVWSPAGPRDFAEFRTRLAAHHLPRLDALGVEYRPLDGPRPWQTLPGVPGFPR